MKTVDIYEYMAVLKDILATGSDVNLRITGGSMTPFLADKRDTIIISPKTETLKRGDMVFYRRDSGMYVLHRIYRVEKKTYTLLGDAQTLPEPGIRPDQILALVTKVRRKGKILTKGSFWWLFFEKVWIRLVPLRPALRAAYSRIKKLFN